MIARRCQSMTPASFPLSHPT